MTSRLRRSDSAPTTSRLKRIHLLPGAEIVTFLPFQITLYFNVFYSPLWMIACVLALERKYSVLATHYKFVTIIMYIIMFIVEASRLYLGYEGNLREKVPELAGFWLLTLLQAPLAIYLLGNIDTLILPFERAVNIVLLIFLVTQILFGIRALQLMVKAQAIKFHLSQFSSVNNERLVDDDTSDNTSDSPSSSKNE